MNVNLDLDKFHAITLSSAINVIIEQGPVQEVEVIAPKNYIELLKKDVSNGHWNIDFKKCLKESKLVEIHLTLENLDDIDIDGSGTVRTNSIFKGDDIELDINGSGNILMELSYKSIEVDINGSGDVNLQGETKEVEIQINGSGDVNLEELISDNSKIRIDGSGDVLVNVSNEIDVTINGSGDVRYTGNPREINSKINGSGEFGQFE